MGSYCIKASRKYSHCVAQKSATPLELYSSRAGMSLVQGQPLKDNGKYSVLRQVNYDRLGVRFFMEDYPIKESSVLPSLVNIVIKAICTQHQNLATEAVLTVPTHMLDGFLRQAILESYPVVICHIIANWPLKTLCLREVIPEEQRDIFLEEMGLDVLLFKGLIKRTENCQMSCLDLRGFPLNETFGKLIIQIWPLLSLKKSQRNAKRLASVVLKKAGNMKDNKMFKEIIPKMLADVIGHDMMKHGDFDIHLPKGVKMVIKIDMLKFSTQDTYFMDYFVSSCLRDMTPLTIEVSSILIRTELRIGDELETSLAPFVVLKGQTHENLQGLCLEDLEENILYWTSPNVTQLTNITSLGLLNCNICLQEGRTRLRTAARQKFTSFISSFPHLRYLDLAMNSFAGCLKEILNVIHLPLEYLNLRECDLNDQDIDSLSQSKHAASLRQLNLCRICGLFVDDSFAVSARAMIDSLKHFTRLTILDLTRNQLGDNMTDRLCEVITDSMTSLKSLSLAENPLCVDSVVKILRTCVQLPALCHIHIPHSHNLMDALNDVPEQSRQQFERKIHDVLKESRREQDIAIEITAMAFSMVFL